MGSRTVARENAFKCLYEIEVQGKADDERLQIFFEEHNITDEKSITYIRDVVNGVEQKLEDIIKMISSNLVETWEYERVAKINKVILKLAIYEMIYVKLDFKIVIDEVIEIAKKYGEDSAPNFINGVLASVVKNFDLKC